MSACLGTRLEDCRSVDFPLESAGHVTKFAPHSALKLIASGKWTFDERVELHRVAGTVRNDTRFGIFLVRIQKGELTVAIERTNKTIKARFWPWTFRKTSLKRFKLFTLRPEAAGCKP